MGLVQSTQPVAKHIYLNELDQHLYGPLEAIIQHPFPLQFERFGCGSGIDVILHEGPCDLYIAECPSRSKKGDFFEAELSFFRGGIIESGWLFDSPAHFFLFYCPVYSAEEETPAWLHVLLIAKARLLQNLSMRGFDRAELATRDELLRKNGRPGIYQSGDPDISFRFVKTDRMQSVFLKMRTDALASFAAANLMVPIGETKEQLTGCWLGRMI